MHPGVVAVYFIMYRKHTTDTQIRRPLRVQQHTRPSSNSSNTSRDIKTVNATNVSHCTLGKQCRSFFFIFYNCYHYRCRCRGKLAAATVVLTTEKTAVARRRKRKQLYSRGKIKHENDKNAPGRAILLSRVNTTIINVRISVACVGRESLLARRRRRRLGRTTGKG